MAQSVIETHYGFDVVDKDEGYSLEVHKNPRLEGIDQGLVYIHPSKFKKEGVLVTGRDFAQYPGEVRNLELDPDKQYLEAGAGLGGFMHELIRRLEGRLKKKPIVIDIANYRVIRDICSGGVEEARIRGYDSSIVDRLRTLEQRANFYLSSENIRLINMSLGNAIRKFPDLVGCADVVVDNIATEQYPHVEFDLSDTETHQINLARTNRKSLTSTFGSTSLAFGCEDLDGKPLGRLSVLKTEDPRINRIAELRRKLVKLNGIILGD
jgi:hypothetical protein